MVKTHLQDGFSSRRHISGL